MNCELSKDFIAQMRNLIGEDELHQLLDALEGPSPTTIRINPAKADRDFLGCAEAPAVPWCAEGVYLADRPSFTLDPLFHAGAYYVQEASSMFIAHLLREYVGDTDITALDLCAAPGGKSTLLQSCLSAGSTLIANEIMPKRAWILRENISKWGGDNVIVTNNRPEDFRRMREAFDLILCDVPCSGEGMFRKDEGAIRDWSLQNVEMCAERQRDIVETIWPCLRPGGLMIYSTCTYNTLEDEENVRWISQELGADILPCRAKSEWNVVGNLLDDTFDCCHFFPHRIQGEGFFCAILRKHGEPTNRKTSSLPLKGAGGSLRLLPDPLFSSLPHGGDLEGALVPVDHPTALRYLHGEALVLPPDVPKGQVIITYRGLPLGLVKNIGNRANNLYPKEWRIRKQVESL
ncbi:MAG: hypothetical protein J5720_04155 [Bacteroidaceae bacterium]|nr:hypothetical protein [Bacteroidaceae bacterium]